MTSTTTETATVPPGLLEVMTERSRSEACFPSPVTDEQRKRSELNMEWARAGEPEPPAAGPVTDEVLRMSREFDDAFRTRHPDGLVPDASLLSAIHLPTRRRKYPVLPGGSP